MAAEAVPSREQKLHAHAPGADIYFSVCLRGIGSGRFTL